MYTRNIEKKTFKIIMKATDRIIARTNICDILLKIDKRAITSVSNSYHYILESR